MSTYDYWDTYRCGFNDWISFQIEDDVITEYEPEDEDEDE